MNIQKTAILTDSSADLSVKMREKYDIRYLPLRVIYPEKDYSDGIDIDPKMVYERFPEEFPTTSTPSIAEVEDALEALKEEGFENVIMITISSHLSGTFNACRLAAEAVEGLEIFVFDSKNVSIGSGLFAFWCGKMLEEGMSFDEICEKLPEKVGDSKVFFYMDTLKYLQRGGRIGKVASAVGSILNLKPIISCNEDGEYYIVSMIRGSKLSKLKLMQEVLKYTFGHQSWIVVEHGDAPEEAVKMHDMIEEGLAGKAILSTHQITATMAIHTGPGLVGIGVFRDPGHAEENN